MIWGKNNGQNNGPYNIISLDMCRYYGIYSALVARLPFPFL